MKHTLETERLRLIPFEAHEFDLLHQTFTHPFVREYLWDNEIIPAERTQEILRVNQQHFASERWGLWKILIKSDDTYAGFVGLWLFFGEPQPQLIYGLLPEKTGFGYATEASQAIINFAFQELNYDYLLAAFDTPHNRSRKVCERLQMHRVEEKEMNGRMTTFYRIDKPQG